jgi:hypothetical protein
LGKQRRIRHVKYDVHAFRPTELSRKEIAKCLSLIKKGSAVDSASAAKQLPQARVVAVVRTGNEIVGVGVIKQPRPAYASKIAKYSEFPFDSYMFELGYVAREPSHRGHNLSEQIVSKLLSVSPAVSLFATTSNDKMKETLKTAGFLRRGKEWRGAKNNRLSLWVKEAETI